ncbi:unnamed protein product [Malus baccata var. baccata]
MKNFHVRSVLIANALTKTPGNAGLFQVAGGKGNLNFLSLNVAEAAAVRDAMLAVVNQGLTRVEMESDSKCDADIDCLVLDIWGLASRMQDVKFVFVPRGGNQAVHVVANHASRHGGSFL